MNSITCRVCQTQNATGNKFCSNCGASLKPRTHITCPNCYHRNPLHLLYCDNCGTRLERSSGTSSLDPEGLGEAGALGDAGAAAQPFTLPTRRPGETGDLDPDSLPDWLRTGGENTVERVDQSAAADLSADELVAEGLDDSIIPDWLAKDGEGEGSENADEDQAAALFPAGILPDEDDDAPESDEEIDPDSLDWLSGLSEIIPAEDPHDSAAADAVQELISNPSLTDTLIDEPAPAAEDWRVDAGDDLENELTQMGWVKFGSGAADDEGESADFDGLETVIDEAFRLEDFADDETVLTSPPADAVIAPPDFLMGDEFEDQLPSEAAADPVDSGGFADDDGLSLTTLLEEAAAEVVQGEAAEDWLSLGNEDGLDQAEDLAPLLDFGEDDPPLADDPFATLIGQAPAEGFAFDDDEVAIDEAAVFGHDDGEEALGIVVPEEEEDWLDDLILTGGAADSENNDENAGLAASLVEEEGDLSPAFMTGDEPFASFETPADDLDDFDPLADLKSQPEVEAQSEESFIQELAALRRQTTTQIDHLSFEGAPGWFHSDEEAGEDERYKQVGGPLDGLVGVIPIAPAVAQLVAQQPELSTAKTMSPAVETEDHADLALWSQVLDVNRSAELQKVAAPPSDERVGRRRRFNLMYLILLFILLILAIQIYRPDLYRDMAQTVQSLVQWVAGLFG